MNRLKITTLLAALTMLTIACNKDEKAEKKEAPVVEKTVEEAPDKAVPQPAEPAKSEALVQIDGLVSGCAASAEARAARHTEKALYERLGGHDPIMAVTKGIIKRHVADDSPIKDLFTNVDLDKLAEHVVNFVGAGTGGPETYAGRSMKDAHAHLNMTPEMFMAAAEDIMQTLAEFKVPENETEEFACIIVSFKDDVLKI